MQYEAKSKTKSEISIKIKNYIMYWRNYSFTTEAVSESKIYTGIACVMKTQFYWKEILDIKKSLYIYKFR